MISIGNGVAMLRRSFYGHMLINMYSALGQGNGYSGASENILIALEKIGVDCRVIRWSKSDKKKLLPETKQILSKHTQIAKLGFVIGFPNNFSSAINQVRIGYTMFETDKLPRSKKPSDWSGPTGKASDAINQMDAVIVPCEHNKKVLERDGVMIPVYVVPLGYNPSQYRLIERPKRKKFTFLITGVLTIRKNIQAVLTAFNNLFYDNTDVQLVIKTSQNTLGMAGDFLNDNYKNITVIDKYVTWNKMINLYRQADAFVWPSRGEGFGLPPIEAMATGLPVILAKNTAMLDYWNEDYNYGVKSSRKAKAVGFPKEWGNVGNWYEVDTAHLTKCMYEVYINRDESRAKGIKAAKWVAENYNYDVIAQRLLNVFAEVIK